MPVIINPKNTEEFERKMEEAEKKEPKFSSVKWGCTSVEEGEEVELSASVQDIADGNMVTLLVFPEVKGPEDGTPLANFPLLETFRNPYIESFFKTLKYTSGYPSHFDSIEEARTWMANFVHWYNNSHWHSGMQYITPMEKRQGKHIEIFSSRNQVLEDAML